MNAAAAPPKAKGALPVLGHAVPLLRRPFAFLASLSACGDLVQVQLGPRRVYVVCSPKLTRQMLLDDRTFDKGGLFTDQVRESLGNGLAGCPHRDHRRQRRLIQPAFHPTRLPSYAKAMSEQITTVTRSWHAGRPVDVLADMQSITAHSIIATTLAGAALTSADMAAIIDDLNTVQKGFYRRMFMPPLLNRLPLSGNRRYHQAKSRLRQKLGRIIADYRSTDTDHGDLLSALITARDPTAPDSTKYYLSDTEITDQLVTFSFAGTETTAALLAWSLHLLAHHPDITQALQHETDHVLAGAPATFNDLPHLELTGRILTETLRLRPAGVLFTRITSRDTELGGYAIPAGTTLAYCPYTLHYRSDFYHNPECFDPDRWKTEQRTPWTTRDTLVPFGAGARKCIGDNFAITEATLALATINAHWHLTPIPNEPARPMLDETLTSKYKGIHLIPTPRRGLSGSVT